MTVRQEKLQKALKDAERDFARLVDKAENYGIGIRWEE